MASRRWNEVAGYPLKTIEMGGIRMNITMNQNADYGNWVPAKMLWVGGIFLPGPSELALQVFGEEKRHRRWPVLLWERQDCVLRPI